MAAKNRKSRQRSARRPIGGEAAADLDFVGRTSSSRPLEGFGQAANGDETLSRIR
jgi:hypothetical protein